MLKERLGSLTCAALLLGAAGGAGASTTTTLVLDGFVPSTALFSFVAGGDIFNTGVLLLDVLESSSGFAFSVEQGDSIEASVTLTDGPFVVPASPNQFIGLNFEGQVPPEFTVGGDVMVSGNLQFWLGSDLVYSTGGSCGNCPSLITFGGTSELTFDRIEASLTFLNLNASHTIESVSLSYQLSQPIPEPATWALWMVGLVGAAGWSRRRMS